MVQVPALYYDIADQAHTLIAGTTGSGKSVALNGVLNTCKNIGRYFVLIDPKKVELCDLAHHPHCVRYADTAITALSALRYCEALMDKRYGEMQKHHIKKSERPHLYIFIDELADLLTSPQAREIKLVMQRILQLGRAANIHMIAATQCPNRKILSAELVLNFTARLGLRCLTAIESRQIINQSGCEGLPMYGEGYYLRPGHQLELWKIGVYNG